MADAVERAAHGERDVSFRRFIPTALPPETQRYYFVSMQSDIDVAKDEWVRVVSIDDLPPGWLRLLHGATLRALKDVKAGDVGDFAVPTSDPRPRKAWRPDLTLDTVELYPTDGSGT